MTLYKLSANRFRLPAFNHARNTVIEALRSGVYDHEERQDWERKNQLKTGDVSPEQVIKIINSCNGTEYKEGRHDKHRNEAVHIFRPGGHNRYHGWYVKFWVDSGLVVFISVHGEVY